MCKETLKLLEAVCYLLPSIFYIICFIADCVANRKKRHKKSNRRYLRKFLRLVEKTIKASR